MLKVPLSCSLHDMIPLAQWNQDVKRSVLFSQRVSPSLLRDRSRCLASILLEDIPLTNAPRRRWSGCFLEKRCVHRPLPFLPFPLRALLLGDKVARPGPAQEMPHAARSQGRRVPKSPKAAVISGGVVTLVPV